MSLTINAASFPSADEDVLSPDSGRLVLAGGCFWCTEAVFQLLEGVNSVRPGYAGGSAETANYRDVCNGDTGHAEVIEINYDPSLVSYGEILKVFFSVAHDPTQLNRQGADVGSQYRSAIFYENENQRRLTEAYIRQLESARVYDSPIRTTLEQLEAFYPAEEYHHDYAQRNPAQPYICAVSDPKVDKLRKAFPDLLKEQGNAAANHHSATSHQR